MFIKFDLVHFILDILFTFILTKILFQKRIKKIWWLLEKSIIL